MLAMSGLQSPFFSSSGRTAAKIQSCSDQHESVP
jgi:hypothetical protein